MPRRRARAHTPAAMQRATPRPLGAILVIVSLDPERGGAFINDCVGVRLSGVSAEQSSERHLVGLERTRALHDGVERERAAIGTLGSPRESAIDITAFELPLIASCARVPEVHAVARLIDRP